MFRSISTFALSRFIITLGDSHERYIKIAKTGWSFRGVIFVPFRMKATCDTGKVDHVFHIFAPSENIRASVKVALLQTNCLKITRSLCPRRTRTGTIFATAKRSVFQILQSPGTPARDPRTYLRNLILISRPLKKFRNSLSTKIR